MNMRKTTIIISAIFLTLLLATSVSANTSPTINGVEFNLPDGAEIVEENDTCFIYTSDNETFILVEAITDQDFYDNAITPAQGYDIEEEDLSIPGKSYFYNSTTSYGNKIAMNYHNQDFFVTGYHNGTISDILTTLGDGKKIGEAIANFYLANSWEEPKLSF